MNLKQILVIFPSMFYKFVLLWFDLEYNQTTHWLT